MTRAPLLLVLLPACGVGMADPKPDPEPPPNVRFERDMMMRYHMHQNYDLGRAIERLLVRGKLDEARYLAKSIAMSPDEPLHGPWIARVVAVRERAQQVANATELQDAIRKSAQLGAACGACHSDQTVKLSLDPLPKLPPDRPTVEARMARHRWAADRLWEGVVGNSDAVWRAGLDVLAETPLDQPADRVRIARELQRKADQTRRAGGQPTDRGTQYGELLVTCASCHTTTK